jgi:recombination protein RecA
MRAALETLLRARKLDVTLTSAPLGADVPADQLAPTGCVALDAALGGGPRRGHLSEIVGDVSSGRTTLMAELIAAATTRGDVAAIVDAGDTFDPPSAAAIGIDLARVLWVRDHGDATRALKAFSLILQAGGFGLVVLDLADVPLPQLRRFPWTTWLRIARTIEGGETVALLVGSQRLARSPGGVTIALTGSSARWIGRAPRERLFGGVASAPRIVSAR